jgi:Holliday junction resolvase RusA-like endonuclease
MGKFNGYLEFTIELPPVTKKNSGQVTKSGIVLPSKAYRQYEKDAVRLIPAYARLHIDEPVNVCATYYTKIDYYAEGRKARVDITNLENALLDVLVAAGVLADDNCTIVISTDGSRVKHDKKNPRTEVVITAISEGKGGSK